MSLARAACIIINNLGLPFMATNYSAVCKRIIGGASAASEATLSSCPLRFAVYVGIIIVRAINPCYVAAAD